MKLAVTRAFHDPNTAAYGVVNNFLAILTITSIVSLVLETVPSLTAYKIVFLTIEWIAVGFFSVEYLARWWTGKPTWKYPTSFFGIVDLVAILPTFLGLGNFTFLKSARVLRILRFLRMLRLLKLSRSNAISEESLGVLWFNVLIYFVILLSALLFAGTAMYLTEPALPSFASIPAGMWWSLKVFMAGIPVTEPATTLGNVFFVLTRFIGLLLLGLLVGVVGNVFRTVLTNK